MATSVNIENVDDIYEALANLKLQSDSLDPKYSCEDSKMLEIIIEHILIHWEDITAVLIDELIEEEVISLNKLEDKVIRGNLTQANHASKSMYGSFHDYKDIDFRVITSIFDEYK